MLCERVVIASIVLCACVIIIASSLKHLEEQLLSTHTFFATRV